MTCACCQLNGPCRGLMTDSCSLTCPGLDKVWGWQGMIRVLGFPGHVTPGNNIPWWLLCRLSTFRHNGGLGGLVYGPFFMTWPPDMTAHEVGGKNQNTYFLELTPILKLEWSLCDPWMTTCWCLETPCYGPGEGRLDLWHSIDETLSHADAHCGMGMQTQPKRQPISMWWPQIC